LFLLIFFKVHIAPVFGLLCSSSTTEPVEYSTRPALQSGPCAVFSCGRATYQPEDLVQYDPSTTSAKTPTCTPTEV